MTKWEYYAYRFVDIVNFNTLDDRMKVFKELGLDGWELVSVDNAMAYFKRPIEEEIPVYKDGVKLEKSRMYTLKESI